MADLFGVTFAQPTALWLLLAAPVFAFLGFWLGRRRRDLARSAIILRALVVALLAVTVAEPLLTTGAGAVSTVFVVDRSRSLTSATGNDINGWINDALKSAGSGDRAAVVSFGASPVLSAAAGPAADLDHSWESSTDSKVDPNFTNIESALALARSLPLGGSRRIVLVSDGAENIGTALNQVGQAATDRTPIDVLPVEGVGESDLQVTAASAPDAVWSGEPVTVVASVSTSTGGPGTVELWVDGVKQASTNATFPGGLSSYNFQVKDLKPGFHALEVRVSGSPASDRYPDNDRMPLALVVRDKPKILFVAPAGTDPDLLSGALERKGAVVKVIEPQAVPSRMSELGVYDAIILNNVPASALTLDQLKGLQEATKSLGRGLVVLGGATSYGPGGYAGTVLEDTLPVTVKVTNGKARPRVALLLIIDKSGSMSYDPLGGASKIEMAKEAAKLAVDAIADGDEIGVLVFNDQQQWVVPMTEIDGQATRDKIDAAIDGVTADGGTEIYPALSVGFDAIRNVDTDVRHIVLLSDGKSRTGTRASYQKLVDDVVADRTTLSTIAIGDDADTDLLQFLAEEGNGRYRAAEKSEDIPRLTVAEAESAGSQAVIRGQFQPIQTNPSPMMQDLKPQDLPQLDGYDYAQVKPQAQAVLTSTRDDPILAKWQYGLGRVVAWTADDGSDFATGWPAWPKFDDFWSSVVRWALPDPEHQPIQVSVKRDGPEAVITASAIGEQGDYVDLANTTATITTPSGQVVPDQQLYQSGPGEYEVRVLAPDPGAYKIEVTQQRGNDTIKELAGFAVPPSPELQPDPDAPALLRTIATRTGGRVLSMDEPEMAFSGGGLHGSALQNYRPIWYVPLSLALALLLLELAIRLRAAPRIAGLFHRRPAST
jgi:uncharacterized membrane protein